MDYKEVSAIIRDIQASPKECQWVEIKENNYNPQLIGEYISALSNGAAYMGQSKGCEERGSGVDRALSQCELYQLPAPDFTTDDFSTKVTMFAPQTLRQMNREDKIRACYQHCCLKYVAGEKMTNESLRGRLEIAETNYSIASRIIADTITAGLIRLDEMSKSCKYAQYIPRWA